MCHFDAYFPRFIVILIRLAQIKEIFVKDKYILETVLIPTY